MKRLLKCAKCGETFEPDWSDKEANKESEMYFGGKNNSQDPRFVVICDDCFQEIHPEKYPELTEQARKELWGKK